MIGMIDDPNWPFDGVNEINEWDFQGNDGCYHKKGQICNKGLIN